MSSSLETKFTGDSSQLEAAYQKIARENVKLREEMKKTHEEQGEAGEHANQLAETLSEHLEEQVGHVVRLGLEWASYHKAVELVTEEFQRQNEIRAKALEMQSEAGPARAQLMRDLGDLSPSDMKFVRAELEKIQDEFGIVGEQTMVQPMLAAMSSTGGNVKQSIANLREAALLTPDAKVHPEAMGGVAGALGNIAKITGDQDPERNAGRLLALQKGAAVTSVQLAQENLMPGVLAAVQHGATANEAFALVASLGQMMMDQTGAETGTAAIKYTQKLDEFFEPRNVEKRVRSQLAHEARAVEGNDEIDQSLRVRVRSYAEAQGIRGAQQMDFKDLMKVLEEQQKLLGLVKSETALVTSRAGVHEFGRQHAALQSDPALRAQFEEGAQVFGRARSIAALRGFTGDKDSLMAQFYAADVAQMPQGEALRAAARAKASQIQSDPAVINYQIQQQAARLEEATYTEKFAAGREAGFQKALAGLYDLEHQGFGSSIGNALRRGWASFGVNMGANADYGPTTFEQEFVLEARQAIRRARYDETKSGALNNVDLGYESEREALNAGELRRTTDRERLEAADKIEAYLRRMVELAERADQQRHENHRENQTTARQNGARAQAAKPRGRET